MTPPTRASTLFALLVASMGAAQIPEIRHRMETALIHLAEGNDDAAAPLLLEIVDEAPFHGPARLQLGALAVSRGEWGVAADHLRAAIEATGDAAPPRATPAQRPGLAWALLAEALDGRGDLAGALDATTEALRFAPTFVPTLLRRSDLARRLGEGDRAEEWSRDRIEHLETALEAARETARLAPDRPGPWRALSLAALGARADDLARCAARRATDVAPEDPGAWLLLARTSTEADPAAALHAAESSLAAGGARNSALWMLLGELRAFRMNVEGSLAAYAEALRLDPAAAGEMASPALDAIAAGDDEELLALLSERARRVPGALSTRFTIAKRALRLGRAADAVRELRALAAMRPDHAAILTALHSALRQTGEPTEADHVLARLGVVTAAEQSAWERSNAREQARRAAQAAFDRGDFAAAVLAWESLVASPAPADGPGRRARDLAALGRSLAALGRAEAALEAFERSLALGPFDAEVLAAAAEVAMSSGQSDAARRYEARAGLVASECHPASP